MLQVSQLYRSRHAEAIILPPKDTEGGKCNHPFPKEIGILLDLNVEHQSKNAQYFIHTIYLLNLFKACYNFNSGSLRNHTFL